MKGYLIEDDDLENTMKVIIVGNGCVGKSSMIQRFCRGVFTRDYKKTIGVDFLERLISVNGENVRLMLWDTAGQEEFDAITRTYYRGASACVLACSITDRNSFNALPAWKTKVTRECGEDVPMVLVANKYDLQKQAVVDSGSLETMARNLGIGKIFKTSVKEDLNVHSVFTYLAQEYLATLSALDEEDVKFRNELIESEAFLSSIDLDEDKPHHKFHTPIFGHFRTNFTKNNNNNNKINLLPKSKSNPMILPNQKSEKKNNLNYTKITSSREHKYKFSANGNHYTHWENMPFRLDNSQNHEMRYRKPKNNLCTIL